LCRKVPPSTGGIARLCNEISIGMNQYYNYVKVITLDATNILTPYNNSKIDIVKVTNKRVYSEINFIKEIRKIKNKGTYDVICGVWHPEALLAFLGGMKNVFILGHGTEFLYGTSKFRKQIWLPIYCKYILGKASNVIANSNYTNNLIQGINRKTKSIALPLAVNHNFFAPKENKSKIDSVVKFSTVARVLQFKGHDFILKSFENLPIEIRSKIEWNIAGTGSYLNELKNLIKSSPIKSQIKIHGFIEDEELANFYNKTDVFILATREQEKSTQVEGFGLVFLEAQSCGVPAIGTNTGGIPDAIEHLNGGWLFEQDNMEELHDILNNIINNPSIINEQSKKARNRVITSCTWEKYCTGLYNILKV